VTDKAKECPKMKFALVGYSQGGMVVSAAAPKIPQDLRQNVVAMVLYGAGKGDGGKGGTPSSDWKQKTLANCAPGDMVNFLYTAFITLVADFYLYYSAEILHSPMTPSPVIFRTTKVNGTPVQLTTL